MVSELYKILEFPEKHGAVGGVLFMFQPGLAPDGLPFEIRKVLWIADVRPGDVRGGHAHYETEEVVICLRGACTIEIDDGLGRQASVRLDRRDRGLLLYPHVWRVVHDFAEGTELLILASRRYDESDYIRDRSRFEQEARRWVGDLGGSASALASDHPTEPV